jgi:hypothetical protein
MKKKEEYSEWALLVVASFILSEGVSSVTLFFIIQTHLLCLILHGLFVHHVATTVRMIGSKHMLRESKPMDKPTSAAVKHESFFGVTANDRTK